MKKKEKTNVMRVLDSKKIKYNEYYYGDTEAVSGVDVAKALGQNPENVFKTLVTTGKSWEHYVFMVPVAEELDLKKAAKAVGEKSIAMLKSKELLGLTGYIHGGCSPIGMKKLYAIKCNVFCLIFIGAIYINNCFKFWSYNFGFIHNLAFARLIIKCGSVFIKIPFSL